MTRLLTALGFAYPWLFRRRAALVGLALALTAGTAEAGRNRATIAPSFVATPVQQAQSGASLVCAAPCAVHFDATGTTAEGVARPFHELRFAWVFGDGATDTRPLAGHVYEAPGTYQVALTVTRPDGSETAFAPPQSIVVAPATAVRRIELQRGQTYPAPIMPAGGGIVSAVGEGADPVIRSGVTIPSNWTLTGVNVQGSVGINPEVSGITLHKIAAQGVYSSTGGGTKHSDRLAVTSSQIVGRPTGTLMFLRFERALILDNTIDNNGQGEFNLRTVHFPRSVIARNHFLRPGNPALGGAMGPRNNLQLRAWGSEQGAASLLAPTIYVVVADNRFENNTSGMFVRTCQENRCTAPAPLAQDMRDLLFEGNTFTVVPGAPAGAWRTFWLQGGDVTIRDNRIDLGTAGGYVLEHSPNMAGQPNLDRDRVQATGNVVLRGATTCNFRAGGTGHLCQNAAQ